MGCHQFYIPKELDAVRFLASLTTIFQLAADLDSTVGSWRYQRADGTIFRAYYNRKSSEAKAVHSFVTAAALQFALIVKYVSSWKQDAEQIIRI